MTSPQPEPQSQPQPEPEPQKDLQADQKPPWGEDFDPQKAWSLIQNLRGDKDKLKTQVDETAVDRQELETLREKNLSADQKAVKDAEKAARAAADAEWRPKLQTAQLRSIASESLKGEQLNAWLSGVNPAAFANDNGDIDQEKVQSYLTATFGVGGQDQQQQFTNGRQQPPAWGQQSGGSGGPGNPAAAEIARQQKRLGIAPAT